MIDERQRERKTSRKHVHNYILKKIISLYTLKTNPKESDRLQFKQIVKGADGREIEPDISYWGIVRPRKDKKAMKLDDLLLVIEIVRSNKDWVYSCWRLRNAFEFKTSMTEGFIYNYEKGQWWRFRRDSDGELYMEEDKDYSRVLGLYLHTLARE